MMQGHFKQHVIDTEQEITKFIEKQSELILKNGSAELQNEFVMSVSALFAARSMAWQHVHTIEPLPSIKKRFQEALDHNLGSALKQFLIAAESARKKQ